MSPGPHRRESDLVRSYVLTRGRARAQHQMEPAALVRAAAHGTMSELDPDRRRIVQVAQGGALAVAELAAHAGLPLTVTLVVVSDLIDEGYLVPASAERPSAAPSPDLLQEVLNGLRRLDTSA
ncbi:DUF742 domain-containing protein [Saccharopolyspora sp. NFXS83]|uniref:DUF742 domain-containing protein n=1 Tax=Saccharopolyspora sp. NFXS83 TaxID=2993560 RepID=UPI00224B19B7|nr:DUF742 domain-containing protein [Saccharopolyspora sp. NFXS83]MCX2730737.1 DUF742 domain-containing protein [Saccharopolyspora sp. NFXS83]